MLDVLACLVAPTALAAAIVELMYKLNATNYDVTLLDLQPFVRTCSPHVALRRADDGVQMCWFMAGRVLVRFLRAAIDCSRNEEIMPLQREISFVRYVVCFVVVVCVGIYGLVPQHDVGEGRRTCASGL